MLNYSPVPVGRFRRDPTVSRGLLYTRQGSDNPRSMRFRDRTIADYLGFGATGLRLVPACLEGRISSTKHQT